MALPLPWPPLLLQTLSSPLLPGRLGMGRRVEWAGTRLGGMGWDWVGIGCGTSRDETGRARLARGGSGQYLVKTQ